jgi:monoamine oxidase
VSTPLYKDIDFSPPLPANKIAVSSSTHLGFTAKMILIYDSPWWRDLGLSGVLNSSLGPLAFTRDSSTDIDEQFSLTCFLVGDPGRRWADIPTAAERKSAFLKHVNVMFAPSVVNTGKSIPQPVHTIEQIWTKEPYIWGCPCPVTALGSLAEGAAKIRRESFGLLHFIGTETSVDYQGYMEGALSSGERGAAEVIALLSK